MWSTEGLKARLRSQALGKGQEQRPSEQPAVGTDLLFKRLPSQVGRIERVALTHIHYHM